VLHCDAFSSQSTSYIVLSQIFHLSRRQLNKVKISHSSFESVGNFPYFAGVLCLIFSEVLHFLRHLNNFHTTPHHITQENYLNFQRCKFLRTHNKVNFAKHDIPRSTGRAVAQAVRRRLPNAAARVRVQVACGVCGGQSGTGAGFLRVLRFPLPIIPPISPLS
jgi:hypothetical protein